MAFPTNPSPGDSYTDEYGTVWVYAGAVNGWYRQSVNPGNATDYRTGDGYVGSDLDVLGDLTLDDGGTYATTLQLITPTANRTISFPDATGTVGLVGGSSGQLVYNNAGAYAGAPSTSVGASGDITLSLAGAASTPPVSLTGTWFSGGTGTTTKPQLLIEPNGTTSTAWSTNGTGLGVNAASGFTGRLFDFQVNGSSRAVLTGAGQLGLGTSSPASLLSLYAGANSEYFRGGGNGTTARDLVISATTGTNAGDTHTINASGSTGRLILSTASSPRLTIDSSGRLGVGATSPARLFHVSGSDTTTRLTSSTATSTLEFETTGGFAYIGAKSGANIYVETNGSERLRVDSSGRLLVGTTSDSGGALLQVNGDRIRVGTAKTPTSATDTGTAGEICWDANYVYVCTATNTWKRSALSSW